MALTAVFLFVGLGVSAATAQVRIIEREMPAPIVEVAPIAPDVHRWNWRPGVWSR